MQDNDTHIKTLFTMSMLFSYVNIRIKSRNDMHNIDLNNGLHNCPLYQIIWVNITMRVNVNVRVCACVWHGYSVAAAVMMDFWHGHVVICNRIAYLMRMYPQGELSTRLFLTFFSIMVSNPTMQVVYSPDGMLHDPPTEVTRGEAKPYLGKCIHIQVNYCYWQHYIECPARLASIKAFIDSQPNQFNVISPQDYSLTPIVQVHEQDYIEFLSTIHQDWVKDGMPPEGTTGESFVLSNVVGKLDPAVLKKNANQTATGRIGYYTFDMSVAFMKGKYREWSNDKI